MRKKSLSFHTKQIETPPGVIACKCSGSSILIVDDMRSNFSNLRHIIDQNFKTNPDIASSGKEALKMQQDKYDKWMVSSSKCNANCCPTRGYSLIFMDLSVACSEGLDGSRKIVEFQRYVNEQMRS